MDQVWDVGLLGRVVQPSHGSGLEGDAKGVVQAAAETGVTERGVADSVEPLLDGELGGENGAAPGVGVVEHVDDGTCRSGDQQSRLARCSLGRVCRPRSQRPADVRETLQARRPRRRSSGRRGASASAFGSTASRTARQRRSRHPWRRRRSLPRAHVLTRNPAGNRPLSSILGFDLRRWKWTPAPGDQLPPTQF